MTPKERYKRLMSARRRMRRDNRESLSNALRMGFPSWMLIGHLDLVVNPPVIFDPELQRMV